MWPRSPSPRAALARLQYDFGYARYQGDPFLVSHALTPALFRYWGEAGRTELFARLRRYNFLFGNEDVVDAGADGACPLGFPTCGPPGLDEESARNRDGRGISAGVEHVLPLAVADVRLRGGYTYPRYSARGSEYSFQGHEVHAGAQASLPAAFVLDGLVRYTYRPYRNRSSFPDPADVRFDGTPYPLQNERRSDDAWRFEVGLGPVVSRFTPRDVAAPPVPSTPFPGPLAVGGILRDACDDPGSGCAGGAGLGLTTSPPEPGLPPGVGTPP